jgi:hypothetical protein
MAQNADGSRRSFEATHELTLTHVRGVRQIVDVMVVDGSAYTSSEWTRGAAPAWRLSKIGWTYRGALPSRRGYVGDPEVRRLGRGSDPKRGTPGKNRTIRVPDSIWARFQAAAEKQGIGVTDWLIEVGELALARASAR